MPATIIVATPPKSLDSPPPPPAIRRYKTKAAIAMGPTPRYEPKMDAAVRSRIKILEMKIADLKGDLAWYDEDKIDRETRIAELLAALSQSQAEGVVFSARIQKARDALLEYDL